MRRRGAGGDHGEIYLAEFTGGKISVIRSRHVRTFVEDASPATVEVGRHGRVYATINVFGARGPTDDAAVVGITPRRGHR